MPARRSSLSSRMAIFEQNIANNAKYQSNPSGSFLTDFASKSNRYRREKKVTSVDNTSVRTVPTVSTSTSHDKNATTMTLSPSRPVPRSILTTKGHGIDGSFDSSISTLDLIAAKEEPKTNQHDSMSSLGHGRPPRSSRRMSMECSAPSLLPGGGDDSLQSLMSMLSTADENTKKSLGKNVSRRASLV